MKKSSTYKVKCSTLVTFERESEAARAKRVADYVVRTRSAFVSTLKLPDARGALAGPLKKRKVAA